MLLLLAVVTLGALVAHIVPHTHDDVGWNKTPQQYFLGANNSIQDAGVQYILDSLIPALEANPSRKFVYCEVAFFAMWWRVQSGEMKNRVLALVQREQLSFVGGGWVQNEEGTTQSDGIIDQMTRGHAWLQRELGVRPTVGWQIDPFDGHTASMASLFADMGYNGLFFARDDYQDHDVRNKTQRLEFIWRSSHSRGSTTDLFTHIFYAGMYCWLDGFAFENDAPPINTDPHFLNNNLHERASVFYQEVAKRAVSYQSNHILVLEGCDFAYQNAHINFKNLDLLMDYINSNSAEFDGLTVQYSTPELYLHAVNHGDYTFSVDTQDFVPYCSSPHWYWTGDYTSRPAFKRYVRESEAMLHASNVAATLFNASTHQVAALDAMSDAVGTVQHHDAITGTERLHVAKSYALHLSLAQAQAVPALGELFTGGVASGEAKLDTCLRAANESLCDPLTSRLAAGKPAAVFLFNALAFNRTELIELPLGSVSSVVVVRADQPQAVLPAQVEKGGRFGNSKFTLLVQVTLPPLALTELVIKPTSAGAASAVPIVEAVPVGERESTSSTASTVAIRSTGYNVTFASDTARLVGISAPGFGDVPVKSELFWYNSSSGADESGAVSGAYLFRPNSTIHFPMDVATNKTNVTGQLVQGPLCQTFVQVWANWSSQEFRVCNGEDFVRVIATIGEIPWQDGLGREVVREWKFPTIDSNASYYGDSNGWEMQHRIRSFRPNFNINLTEPIASNYYPYSTAAVIRDRKTQVSLVPDRPRGFASLASGQIETMLHRRLLHDDHLGVGEALNDTSTIVAAERVYLTSPEKGPQSFRHGSLQVLNPPLMLVGDVPETRVPLGSALDLSAWPSDVHVVSLDPRPDQKPGVLVRLHNMYAADEAAARNVTVSLKSLVPRMSHATRMTATLLEPVASVQRLQWKTPEGMVPTKAVISGDGDSVTLGPMELATFLVDV